MFENWQYCRPCAFANWMSFLQNGPIGVVVFAFPIVHYESGVIDPTNCGISNHAVIAVAWDAVDAQNGIIKVRNSWGAKWGEGGFFRIKYNPVGNSCHVNDNAFQPIFASTGSISKSNSVKIDDNGCFTPSSTFQTSNGWGFTHGINGTLLFTANGPLQIQYNNSVTNKVVHYTSLSGWNNTMTSIATNLNYTKPISNFTYTLDPTRTYNYNITYTNKNITITVGTQNIQFMARTGVNFANATSLAFSGNGNTQVCNLQFLNTGN